MKFAHAKPAWIFPQRLDDWPSGDPAEAGAVAVERAAYWDDNCTWRPGLWCGTSEKGPRAGWHYGVWWDVEGKQNAFHLPPDHVDLQPKPPTLAKPQRTS